MTFLESIGVSVASFILGALLTGWWNRARPLILLRGFNSILSHKDRTQCHPELVSHSKLSWHGNALGNDASLGELDHLRITATIACTLYSTGLQALPGAVEALQRAETPEEIRDSLRSLISHRGISEAMEMALLTSEITIAPKPPNSAPILEVAYTDRDNGSYTVMWPSTTSQFASGLNARKHLRSRLEPFVSAMRRLHKPALWSAFSQLEPILRKQLETQQHIRDILTPLLESKHRWTGKLLLANYGAAPMMIWPEATILVRHTDSNARFRIEAYLAQEIPQDPRIVDVDGLLVLAPGEKMTLWAITKGTQEETRDGAVVQTHFSEGSGQACVRLKITRRGSLMRSRLKSNSAKFAASVALSE